MKKKWRHTQETDWEFHETASQLYVLYSDKSHPSKLGVIKDVCTHCISGATIVAFRQKYVDNPTVLCLVHKLIALLEP